MSNKSGFIVKCLNLETGESYQASTPWESQDLARRYAEYAERLGRGKKRYRVVPLWNPPPPPARPVLADHDTYLQMDV